MIESPGYTRLPYAMNTAKSGAAMPRFHPIDRFSDDVKIVDLPNYRFGASRRYVKLEERLSVRAWVPKQFVADDAIAGNGKPHAPRIGFLKGRISVPDDFDAIGQAEIEAMFGG